MKELFIAWYVLNALFTIIVLEFAYEKRASFFPHMFTIMVWPATWTWLLCEWADKRTNGTIK
jgi:hypothetical protein